MTLLLIGKAAAFGLFVYGMLNLGIALGEAWHRWRLSRQTWYCSRCGEEVEIDAFDDDRGPACKSCGDWWSTA